MVTNVAYISTYAYARGAANSARSSGFISALQHQSITVHEMIHETFISARHKSPVATNIFDRLPKMRLILLGTAVKEWLTEIKPTPDVVIVFGTDPRFLRPARLWAKRNAVPIVNDVVDWYQVSEGTSIGEKAFIAVNNLWAMPYEAAKCDSAIVVSALLGRYFSERGLPTLRIPAIIDDNEFTRTSQRLESPPRLAVSYAGKPGKRDYRTIENLAQLAERPSDAWGDITFHLVGFTPDDALKRRLGPPIAVQFHGRLPRDQANALVAGSDFTVLQRPSERRFAQAGFPTKIAESLLAGVPVIANLTGDLCEFLDDGFNAIILSDDSTEALDRGLSRAREWAWSGEIDADRIRELARKAFNPQPQAAALSSFLDRCLP